MPCLTAKPIVNGIEKDLQGRAEVVRLNVISKLGRELAGRYGVAGVPTTLVLNHDGAIAYRHTGIPSRKRVVAEVTGQ